MEQITQTVTQNGHLNIQQAELIAAILERCGRKEIAGFRRAVVIPHNYEDGDTHYWISVIAQPIFGHVQTTTIRTFTDLRLLLPKTYLWFMSGAKSFADCIEQDADVSAVPSGDFETSSGLEWEGILATLAKSIPAFLLLLEIMYYFCGSVHYLPSLFGH